MLSKSNVVYCLYTGNHAEIISASEISKTDKKEFQKLLNSYLLIEKKGYSTALFQLLDTKLHI